jgi:tungstate transport system ATP-binding protein
VSAPAAIARRTPAGAATRREGPLPLVLEEVSFAAGGQPLISSLSLAIGPGLRTVVLGPNGAGKSLLLRLCHGLIRPGAGTVRWAEADPRALARMQAMVFQRPVLLRRTVLANLTFALAVAGVPRRLRGRRAEAALERVGLQGLDGRPARVLSGGEQQRLALARAWALEPKVLFLDEPSANLDPTATRMIEAAIGAMHREGVKIVMTTHDLAQARRLADEIIFLHRGRLVEHTPADVFFRRPASPEGRAFVAGELLW